MNIIYVGIENPISISVFNYKCEEVFLKADKGVLTETNCGEYSYQVNEEGDVYFTVYRRNAKNNILLDSILFKAKQLPDAVCKSYNFNEAFSVVRLRNIQSLSEVIRYNPDDSFEILKFDYLLTRDTAIITRGHNNSQHFNSNLQESIKQLQPNDRVFFEAIIIEDKNGEIKKLNPICLTISIY